MNSRAPTRARRKTDSTGLQTIADHFFHRIHFFGARLPLISGFAHDRQPHRRMRHQWRYIDADSSFQITEVLGKRSPPPYLFIHIVVQDPSEIGHQDLERLALGWHGSTRSAAITDDDRGDAEIHHRISVRVEDKEQIHVRVRINESRRDGLPPGIDLSLAGP